MYRFVEINKYLNIYQCPITFQIKNLKNKTKPKPKKEQIIHPPWKFK